MSTSSRLEVSGLLNRVNSPFDNRASLHDQYESETLRDSGSEVTFSLALPLVSSNPFSSPVSRPPSLQIPTSVSASRTTTVWSSSKQSCAGGKKSPLQTGHAKTLNQSNPFLTQPDYAMTTEMKGVADYTTRDNYLGQDFINHGPPGRYDVCSFPYNRFVQFASNNKPMAYQREPLGGDCFHHEARHGLTMRFATNHYDTMSRTTAMSSLHNHNVPIDHEELLSADYHNLPLKDFRAPAYERQEMPPNQNYPVGANARKNSKKPAEYDGKTSFRDYLSQFELISDLNGWSEATRALELATSLRGPAQSILSDLDISQRYNFAALVGALMSRFEPTNQSEVYRAQLKGRVRHRSEALTEMAQDIKRLVRLGYPSAGLDVREALALECFMDSLNDSRMELFVFQVKPARIEEALKAALEFEAFVVGRARRSGGQRPHDVCAQVESASGVDQAMNLVKTQLEALQDQVFQLKVSKKASSNAPKGSRLRRPAKVNTDGACFYCGKVGHFATQCGKRQRDNRGNKMQDSSSSEQSMKSVNSQSGN